MDPVVAEVDEEEGGPPRVQRVPREVQDAVLVQPLVAQQDGALGDKSVSRVWFSFLALTLS